MDKKILQIYTITIQAEVYRIPYSIRDLENMLTIFNEIHENGMIIKIKEVKIVNNK